MAPLETGPSTTFKTRLELALRLMAAKGLRSYAPPLHRLMWYCSVPIRPPHFASFLGNFVLMGGWFGVFWGGVMWLLIWSRRDLPASVAILLSILAGVLFGAAMAGYFAYSARKHQLPNWSELRAEADAFD